MRARYADRLTWLRSRMRSVTRMTVGWRGIEEVLDQFMSGSSRASDGGMGADGLGD
jgi:hypothetical protein